MKRTVNIGILGEYDLNKTSHPATISAINHAAGQLSLQTNISWLPTPSLLAEEVQKSLKEFDCLWASSGSPYKSMEGMLTGIRVAREIDRPFIGT
jgi:CTP synthase (UTP-ammonia lyase)